MERLAIPKIIETHAIYDSDIKRLISKHANAEGAKTACRATNFANWHKTQVVDRYKILELPKPVKPPAKSTAPSVETARSIIWPSKK